MIEVAIIGGGPAGAYCGCCLSEKGIYSTIFDHTHPREKPCGGIISPLAKEMLPFLAKLPIEHVKRRQVIVVTPSGRKVSFKVKQGEILCVSRMDFDMHLLNTAMNKGARWIKEKVVDIRRNGKIWRIRTERQLYKAKKLVGADGVNSLTRRKLIGPLSPADKGICQGYFVDGLENEEISIHFLPHRRGYIWVVPRRKNTSIGIGCTEIARSKNLKKELDAFLARNYPSIIGKASRWATLIPNIKSAETYAMLTAGKNWLLLGDAAGHVDPINGEGLLYSLLDGQLAAEAIAEEKMELFDELWRQTYGLSLWFSIKFRKWIYTKPFLEFYPIRYRIRRLVPF